MTRRPASRIAAAGWTAALAIALLWPGHALSTFDGLPLDGRAEAVVIGVVFPALWWAHRRFLEQTAVRLYSPAAGGELAAR